MDLESKLSKHFKLKELVRTSHRTMDNTPTEEVVARLTTFCEDFLEPIREKFGAIYISSGYRRPALNTKVGGSKNSAHKFGCAADFIPLKRGVSCLDIVKWVIHESKIAYDQVIDEHSSTSQWVHLGMIRPGFQTKPRYQKWVFQNGIYTKFKE